MYNYCIVIAYLSYGNLSELILPRAVLIIIVINTALIFIVMFSGEAASGRLSVFLSILLFRILSLLSFLLLIPASEDCVLEVPVHLEFSLLQEES